MPHCFETLSGIGAPLAIANLDTDVIIRVARLAALPPEELGPYALESLRRRPDGSPDPDFILNRPPYDAATILVAGPNFGCGSSREAAVWALWGYGIRCVVAPSFGSIFHENCFENGLLPIVLPPPEIERLQAQLLEHPELTVDLEGQEIRAPNRVIPFEVEPLRRVMLLEGLDPIALTLRHASTIAAFQAQDALRRPWLATGRDPELD